VGWKVGLPSTTVGIKVGVPVGRLVGSELGCGVGDPRT